MALAAKPGEKACLDKRLAPDDLFPYLLLNAQDYLSLRPKYYLEQITLDVKAHKDWKSSCNREIAIRR